MNEVIFTSGIKRKTIDEFFQPAADRKRPKSRRTSKEQALPGQNDIPGLRLIPSFVTLQEEIELLKYLDAQVWRTDLSRRVIHYGGTYCLMAPANATAEEKKNIENTVIKAAAMPVPLEDLVDRLVDSNLYKPYNKPQYCIVNEYRHNQGISAHVENFKFISPICGLTLGHGDWIRFHELVSPDDGSVRSRRAAMAKRTGRQVDVWMPSRSLLVMGGDSREVWQHEIVRSRKDRHGPDWRRVSLTFRAERKAIS